MPEYRERYYQRDLPLPPNYKSQHPFDNGALILRDENLAAWPRTEEVIRDQLAEYYGLITHLDQQVGRILPPWTKTVRRRTRSSSTPRTTGWRSAATACSASRTCTSTRCAAR